MSSWRARLRDALVVVAASLIVLFGLLGSSTWAQYPGRVTKTDKNTPILRSVAVLEWTGDAGKPSASRLVPIAVYDGEQLNDGTIYLTRPEPLALANGVEYELQNAGKPTGLFDVFAAGEVNGTWQGFGAWKPLTAPETAKSKTAFNTSSLYGGVDIPDDDKPVLKRKHPKGTDSDDAGASSGGAAKPSSSGGSASSSSDSDRPTLKRKSGDDSSASGASSSDSVTADPDRPTLRRTRHAADTVETSNTPPDPDRPRLQRGKPADAGATEIPELKGHPPSMQQAVAVSDSSHRVEHPWGYTWANPDDELKMKESLEALARTALGLDVPPAPAKPTSAKAGAKTTVHKKTPLVPPAPTEPVALADEQFRVFELAYGSSATMVLTASTPLPTVPDSSGGSDKSSASASDEPAPPVIKRGKPTSSLDVKPTAPAPAATTTQSKAAAQKYVTLVAQPDLYGGVMVLFKSVTDAGHLDDTPRMRLVDAVDAMADNRGELLFELRGKTQRQFALFRVLRGSAEQLFATVAMP